MYVTLQGFFHYNPANLVFDRIMVKFINCLLLNQATNLFVSFFLKTIVNNSNDLITFYWITQQTFLFVLHFYSLNDC